MRWPHVEDHSFADVAQVFAGPCVGCGDTRPGIRRFYFARGESHVATLRLCWQGAAVAQVQSRIHACQMIPFGTRKTKPRPQLWLPARRGKKLPRPAELRFRRGKPNSSLTYPLSWAQYGLASGRICFGGFGFRKLTNSTRPWVRSEDNTESGLRRQ